MGKILKPFLMVCLPTIAYGVGILLDLPQSPGKIVWLITGFGAIATAVFAAWQDYSTSQAFQELKNLHALTQHNLEVLRGLFTKEQLQQIIKNLLEFLTKSNPDSSLQLRITVFYMDAETKNWTLLEATAAIPASESEQLINFARRIANANAVLILKSSEIIDPKGGTNSQSYPTILGIPVLSKDKHIAAVMTIDTHHDSDAHKMANQKDFIIGAEGIAEVIGKLLDIANFRSTQTT